MTSPFPGSVPNYPTRIESNPGTRITDEVVKVPAGSPFRARLVQKPRLGDAVVARVQGTGAARTRVPWGTPILPGTFALRDRDAALEHHPNDANLNILFSYVGVGSVVSADIINTLQDDIKAVMTWLGPSGGRFVRVGDYDGSEGSLMMFDLAGGDIAAPANLYQDNATSSLATGLKVKANRGFSVREVRYGSGGSTSLQTGWNRILTVASGPTSVHGVFEVAYSLPGSVRGRLVFAASSSETGSAQLTILTNTCAATNSVFTSMRILRPNSGVNPAAVEIYLSTATNVIIEIRQVVGTVFDAANQSAFWSFVVPATAGSLTGMTNYDLNVADAVFATNCNNNGFAVSATGVIMFQGAPGVFLGSNAFSPNIAGAIALGTASLPFGPIHCAMDAEAFSGYPMVRFNTASKSLVADGGVLGVGDVIFYDRDNNLVQLSVTDGAVRHLGVPEE